MPSKVAPPRIKELDGLRGFLAVWVAVSHIFCLSIGEGFLHWRHFGDVVENFAYAGPAVETFIILSGFSISFLLDSRFLPYGRYLLERFFRLMPVYLLCLLFGLLVNQKVEPWLVQSAPWHQSTYLQHLATVAAAVDPHLTLHVGYHLFLLHGVLPSTLLAFSATSLLPPAWSISLEWQYYLVAPLLAWVVRRGWGILALAAIVLVGERYGYYWENPIDAFLPGRLDIFLIGIGSYHLYALYHSRAMMKEGLFSILFAAGLAGAISLQGHLIPVLIWLLAFGGVLTVQMGRPSRILSAIQTLLCSRLFQFLGRISYPLYLVHWPLIVLFLSLQVREISHLTRFSAFFLTIFAGLPLIVLVSFLIHRIVEAPGMRWGKSLARARPEKHSLPASLGC